MIDDKQNRAKHLSKCALYAASCLIGIARIWQACTNSDTLPPEKDPERLSVKDEKLSGITKSLNEVAIDQIQKACKNAFMLFHGPKEEAKKTVEHFCASLVESASCATPFDKGFECIIQLDQELLGHTGIDVHDKSTPKGDWFYKKLISLNNPSDWSRVRNAHGVQEARISRISVDGKARVDTNLPDEWSSGRLPNMIYG